MYKLGQDGIKCYILRLSDNVEIPINNGNLDYQAYLKWVSEGNTPLPADE